MMAVGRQSFYKGFDDLLRAAASVPGLHLVLAGPGTRAAWQPLVRTLGLTERVQLADYQPANRLHALLRTCDGLCLPSNSRAEAFGLVLLEAMLHGKPVIAADVAGSGISEVVAPGRTGQLFPPGDVAALAAALTDLARDPARWKAMGEQGRQRFTRHYRIDAGAAALDALYRELPVGCRLEERLRDEPGL